MSATPPPASRDAEIPCDPGDAMQEILRTADELVTAVKGAYAAWLEKYPLLKLMNEWNAELQQFQTEQSRVQSLNWLAYDIGWNQRVNPEIIHQQVREIYLESVLKEPQEPNWLEIKPIASWRDLRRTAVGKMERLTKLRLAALPIVGAFPDRPDTKIQEAFDWLLSECNNLAQFAPLEFSSRRKLTEAAVKTETVEIQNHLNLLAGRIPYAENPLKDLLAMYRGKCRPFTATTPPVLLPVSPPQPKPDLPTAVAAEQFASPLVTRGGEGAAKGKAGSTLSGKRNRRRFTDADRERIEAAVSDYLKQVTASATQAERYTLAEAVVIADVASAADCSTGYLSKNSPMWMKFQEEREERAGHGKAAPKELQFKSESASKIMDRAAVDPATAASRRELLANLNDESRERFEAATPDEQADWLRLLADMPDADSRRANRRSRRPRS